MDKSWKDSEAKKQWDKENTVRYSIKLNKNTDQEIIAQVERMTGTVKDPKTGEKWTTHGAIRHFLQMALLEEPEMLTLIREARKLTPEQLEMVIELVERINAGEDREAVAKEITARMEATAQPTTI